MCPPTSGAACHPRLGCYEPRWPWTAAGTGWTSSAGSPADAARWLAPGGYLLIETSERQAPATVAAIARHGLLARVAGDDELDATVVIGAR